MDNVERLMEFGLTRHEASLYILLTLEGSLNGYEAAKQSGISRSNAYNALAGLVDKGAAYIQEEDTVRYIFAIRSLICCFGQKNEHISLYTMND